MFSPSYIGSEALMTYLVDLQHVLCYEHWAVYIDHVKIIYLVGMNNWYPCCVGPDLCRVEANFHTFLHRELISRS